MKTMDILRTKRDWIKWCHADAALSRHTRPPPEYPVAAEWDIDGSETTYPTYWTRKELRAILKSMSNKESSVPPGAE
jgi:hypothetical protein